jgi:hypothetical protein
VYQLAHGSLGELYVFRMMKLQMGLQNLAKQAGDLVFARGACLMVVAGTRNGRLAALSLVLGGGRWYP